MQHLIPDRGEHGEARERTVRGRPSASAEERERAHVKDRVSRTTPSSAKRDHLGSAKQDHLDRQALLGDREGGGFRYESPSITTRWLW